MGIISTLLQRLPQTLQTQVAITVGQFDSVAQNAHMLAGGYGVVLSVYLFGLKSLWIAIPLIILAAAAKEFWYDSEYESTDERGSDLRDWIFYLIGLGIGLGFIALKVFLLKNA